MEGAKPKGENAGFKKRVEHEAVAYGINVVYLALFFGVFVWYRRWILASYHITYIHYGIGLIQALILAKVILVGDAIGLGRRFEEMPLIVTALCKTFIFALFAGAFGVLEHTVMGLVHGKGLEGAWLELFGEKSKYELLSRCLVVFAAFIPFFAFRELERVLGEGRIARLLFQGKAGAKQAESTRSGDKASSDGPDNRR